MIAGPYSLTMRSESTGSPGFIFTKTTRTERWKSSSERPLLEAFQHATTEMQKLLVADYGFNERGAAAFMGQAVEYEIANVVDPRFTVVAKVRKSFLRR